MFTSSASIVAMKCGHYIHRACYDAFMQTSYRCPICGRSAVNMELQWRKLDHAIEGQPMPEQYRQTKVWIVCNDCSCRSCVSYHWLGNKCARCDGYNTSELGLENAPVDEIGPGPALHPSVPDVLQTDHIETGADSVRTVVPDEAHSRDSRSTAIDPADGFGPQGLHTEDVPHAAGAVPLPGPQPMHEIPSFCLQAAPRASGESHQQDIADSWEASHLEHDVRPSGPLQSREGDSAVPSDDEGDDTAFWGESISPSQFIPSGWSSPRIFATSPANEDTATVEPSSLGSGESAWPFLPSNWRIGSPRLFGSNKSDGGTSNDPHEMDETESSSGWPIHPSQWRLGSPRSFLSRAQAVRDADGIPIESNDGEETSNWPIDPRRWRFGSPRLFPWKPGPSQDTDLTDEEVITIDEDGIVSGWQVPRLPNIHPSHWMPQGHRIFSWSSAGTEQVGQHPSSSDRIPIPSAISSYSGWTISQLPTLPNFGNLPQLPHLPTMPNIPNMPNINPSYYWRLGGPSFLASRFAAASALGQDYERQQQNKAAKPEQAAAPAAEPLTSWGFDVRPGFLSGRRWSVFGERQDEEARSTSRRRHDEQDLVVENSDEEETASSSSSSEVEDEGRDDEEEEDLLDLIGHR